MGGRAPKRGVEYRRRIEACVTPDDVLAVLDHLRHLALTEDDVPAARVWLEHVLGKPRQQVDLGRK